MTLWALPAVSYCPVLFVYAHGKAVYLGLSGWLMASKVPPGLRMLSLALLFVYIYINKEQIIWGDCVVLRSRLKFAQGSRCAGGADGRENVGRIKAMGHGHVNPGGVAEE